MLSENQAFWVRGEDGQEYGPVGLRELREWVGENRAGIGTEVRRDEAGSRWQPWQSYPELVAMLAEVHATSLVPGQAGLVVAPLGRRIIACLIDVLLSSILASPIIWAVMTSADLPNWQQQFMDLMMHPDAPHSPLLLHYIMINNAITYAILALYMIGFHAAHGKTPAKALLRLRVVDETGGKPPVMKAMTRGLAFVVSFYLYGIPLSYAFFNPQRRAFHDFIAGTYVVEA